MTQTKAVHEKLDVFGNFGSMLHHVGVLAVRSNLRKVERETPEHSKRVS